MKDNLDGIKYLVEFISRRPQIYEIKTVGIYEKNDNKYIIKMKGKYENNGITNTIRFKHYQYNPDTKWIIFTANCGTEKKMQGFMEASDLLMEFPAIMMK